LHETVTPTTAAYYEYIKLRKVLEEGQEIVKIWGVELARKQQGKYLSKAA
jgi:hypothetical protein